MEDLFSSARKILKALKKEERELEAKEIAREIGNPNIDVKALNDSDSDDSFFGGSFASFFLNQLTLNVDDELDRNEKISFSSIVCC